MENLTGLGNMEWSIQNSQEMNKPSNSPVNLQNPLDNAKITIVADLRFGQQTFGKYDPKAFFNESGHIFILFDPAFKM